MDIVIGDINKLKYEFKEANPPKDTKTALYYKLKGHLHKECSYNDKKTYIFSMFNLEFIILNK